MIDEREIWACANYILQCRGDAANVHAIRRADTLLSNGDLEGQRTWLRILERIRQLESTTPPASLLN